MAQEGNMQNDSPDRLIWPLSNTSSEATAMLENFWPKVMEDINKLTSNDFKNQELPLARIKKIMKLDDDVKIMMISAEAPVLFAKAAEMFITELSLRAWLHTEDNKRRTLQRNDIAMAVSKYDQFDFLIDIVPREELKPVKKPTTPILTPPHLLTTTGTVQNATGTTMSLDAATLAANGTSIVQQDQVQYLINQAAIQQQANAAAAAAGQQIQLIPQSGLMMTTGPDGRPQLIYVQVPTAPQPAQASAGTAPNAVSNNVTTAATTDLNQTVQTTGQSHPGETQATTTTTMMATGPNGQPQLIYVQVPSNVTNATNATTVTAVATNQSNSASDLTSIVQTPEQSHAAFTQ